MKKLNIALSLLAAASMSSLAGTLINPAPGMWEQSTYRSLDGQTWRPGVQTKGCLSPEQSAAWESQVRQQITAAGCTINSLTVASGKINGVIACQDSTSKSTVNVDGMYTDKAYSVELKGVGVSDFSDRGGPSNLQAKSFAKWSGRRVGSCGA